MNIDDFIKEMPVILPEVCRACEYFELCDGCEFCKRDVEWIVNKAVENVKTTIVEIIQEGEQTNIGREVTIKRILDFVKEQDND